MWSGCYLVLFGPHICHEVSEWGWSDSRKTVACPRLPGVEPRSGCNPGSGPPGDVVTLAT